MPQIIEPHKTGNDWMSNDVFMDIEALDPADKRETVLLGVRREIFQKLYQRGLNSSIGQLFGIAKPGAILAQHCYRGLERPLLDNNNQNGADNVFVYSWKPQFDYVWKGDRFHGGIQRIAAPAERVFVVLVSRSDDSQSRRFGTIERWNWLPSSDRLNTAPVDYEKRYSKICW